MNKTAAYLLLASTPMFKRAGTGAQSQHGQYISPEQATKNQVTSSGGSKQMADNYANSLNQLWDGFNWWNPAMWFRFGDFAHAENQIRSDMQYRLDHLRPYDKAKAAPKPQTEPAAK